MRRRLPAGGLALRADMQRRLLLVRADVRERPGAEVLQEVSRLLLLLLHLQTAAETKNRHFKTISDQNIRHHTPNKQYLNLQLDYLWQVNINLRTENQKDFKKSADTGWQLHYNYY